MNGSGVIPGRPAARVALLVGALALALASRAGAEGEPAGPLRFEPAALALGEVARGTVVEADVEVVNASRAEIAYAGVATAGVSVAASPPVVAPGGRARLRLSIRTGELPDAGLEQIAIIFARGPERFQAALPVRIELDTLFIAMPAEVDFGPVLVGEETRARPFSIAPRARHEAEVVGIDAPAGVSVTAAGSTLDQGRTAPQFMVSLRPPPRVGRFDAVVRFRLAGAPLAAIPLRIRADVRSDVSVAPPAVDLGRVVRGLPFAPRDVVLAASLRPVAVLGVEADAPVEASAVADPSPGGAARVRVAVAAGAGAGRFAGAVRIFLDRVELPCLRVPVRVEVVEPLALEPEAAFLEAEPGGTAEATVRVRAEPGVDPAAIRAESDAPELTVTLERDPADPAVFALRLRARAPREATGLLRTHVALRTGLAARPEIQLPVVIAPATRKK